MNQTFTLEISDERQFARAVIIQGDKQLIIETPPFCGDDDMDWKMRIVFFSRIADALRGRCFPEDVIPKEPESPQELTIPDGPPCG